MSEVLRLSSAAWSLLHVLVLFLFFYSSRLERKKTLVITLSTWGAVDCPESADAVFPGTGAVR